jgi:hypothetical protein
MLERQRDERTDKDVVDSFVGASQRIQQLGAGSWELEAGGWQMDEQISRKPMINNVTSRECARSLLFTGTRVVPLTTPYYSRCRRHSSRSLSACLADRLKRTSTAPLSRYPNDLRHPLPLTHSQPSGVGRVRPSSGNLFLVPVLR